MSYNTYDRTARDLADRFRSRGSVSRALQTISSRPAARDAAASLGGRIREQPLVAVMVAAVIGYIVGRIGRHI